MNSTLRILTGVLAALIAIASVGCESKESSAPAPKLPEAAHAPEPVPSGPMQGVLVIQDMGEIVFEFLPELAPGTVANFQKLAREGFYAGTTFHRIIPGFMIQGGDPNSKNDNPRDDGTGGPGYQIKAEFSDEPHERGILSMARSRSPDSAGSQFFIVTHKSEHLDGKYTVFGRVTRGMEVVDRMSRVETDKYGDEGPKDRPIKDVVIEEIRIEPLELAEAPDEPEAAPE